MKFRPIVLSLIILSISCSERSEVDRRVDAILSQMTLDEKIGQMNQLDYGSVNSEIIAAGKAGSVLNCVDAARINELQRAAVEESRLGIPLLMARDVIHGFHTVFPIPLGQAATFDAALVEDGARIAAKEATSHGVRWTFSPMVDIARDARWGRIAESFGEDSYLASVLGAAMVRGYQGKELSSPTSMAACAKHFAGYGASEGGRDYNTANIPERVLRNSYLPPFQACSDEGAATFMTSFNDVNGVPSTANRWLLDEVLRGEWGWDGMIVTDWNSAGELIAHGVATDLKDAAELSVNAGVDMDMMSYSFIGNVSALVKEGKLKEKQIDDAVRRILKLKFELGLFEQPYIDESNAGASDYCEEHLAAAKKAALESAVLLKNEGVLPLKEGSTVLVCGPMADASHDQLGTWAPDGQESHSITALMGLSRLFNVIYEPVLEYSRDYDMGNFAALKAKALRSDAIIMLAGEEAILSGEAHSLADVKLQGAQREFIDALSKLGKPLVTVVMAGRPLEIEQELEDSDAMIYSFHPGTMGGEALAELISGRAVPSGKLPVSFVHSSGQYPFYYNHSNTGRPNQGNETLIGDLPLKAGQVSNGCTSYYLDAGYGELLPFGYGLSYTSFKYSNITLSSNELHSDDVLKVEFELTNSGDYDADEVAMLFIQDLVGSIVRPVKELKRFERVSLKAGESKHICFELPIKELAFYGLDNIFKVEAGNFKLWVAGNSADGEAIPFKVI